MSDIFTVEIQCNNGESFKESIFIPRKLNESERTLKIIEYILIIISQLKQNGLIPVEIECYGRYSLHVAPLIAYSIFGIENWTHQKTKQTLVLMTKTAVRLNKKHLSFLQVETQLYCELVKHVFGDNEASGFLNLVLDIIRKSNMKISFNKAVVKAIANHYGSL